MELPPYRLDFALPWACINIEIDGYWHGDRQKQDRKRDLDLASRGWQVIRLSANSLLNRPEESAQWIQEQILSKLEV
jgi:very-short-patch-repair endonuclease